MVAMVINHLLGGMILQVHGSYGVLLTQLPPTTTQRCRFQTTKDGFISFPGVFSAEVVPYILPGSQRLLK